MPLFLHAEEQKRRGGKFSGHANIKFMKNQMVSVKNIHHIHAEITRFPLHLQKSYEDWALGVGTGVFYFLIFSNLSNYRRF